MERWRYAGWGFLIAGVLAGCADMRWCRDCCSCCGSNAQPAPPPSAPVAAPTAESTAIVPPGAAAGAALSIPGAPEGRLNSVAGQPSAGNQIQPAKATRIDIQPPPAALPFTAPSTSNDTAPSQQSPLRRLHARAKQKFESLNVYEMRMRRREVVGGKSKPEELIQARFRRDPFSVYFRWIGPEAKGREVVYVKGQHGDLIHTLTAKDDVLLMPAGMRFKIAPDSPMVKGKSRTAITEAGLGSLIDRFGTLADAAERGGHGMAKSLGLFKRTEFEEKVEGVMQTIPPGAEPLLTGGGQRLWCFDPGHGLPILIVTHDEQNREVEYCCHDRFTFPTNIGDEAFDPERLWRK